MWSKILFGLSGIILISTLFYYVCGGGGSSSGGSTYNQKDVQFSVNCSGVDCKNCDERRDYPEKVECYWYCGNYQGKTRSTIGVWFWKNTKTNCWEYSTTASTDGRCK